MNQQSRDYVIIDVETDGQEHQRVLWIEGIKVINGQRDQNLYAFNFCKPGENSIPDFLFIQELMSFVKGFPVICFGSETIKDLIEYELKFYQFEGFIEYICVQELAYKKLNHHYQLMELIPKFDLSSYHEQKMIAEGGHILDTYVEDIYNVYQRLLNL